MRSVTILLVCSTFSVTLSRVARSERPVFSRDSRVLCTRVLGRRKTGLVVATGSSAPRSPPPPAPVDMHDTRHTLIGEGTTTTSSADAEATSTLAAFGTCRNSVRNGRTPRRDHSLSAM
ncbi:hypothetical protein HPB50_021183 [Hyalomma asiaticum]|uniref:Uncharacterized protein n=1 Tax=Hyalomma asiaticum TaxID=266040 RepID=A0ACB7RVM0_HYAAI|nr:hypothetical protein HPB50_021183 [Hyalomma asiaticum]